MKNTALLALFNVLLLLAVEASATPWTLEEGKKQAELSFSWTGFTKVKLYNGSQKNVGQVNFYTQSSKLFYGIRDGLTVFLSVPYRYTTRINQNTFQGLGDAQIALHFRVLDEADANPLTLSLKTAVKLPLSNYEVYALHAFGDGQIDVELHLFGGRMGFVNGHLVYISSGFGYRIRNGKPSHEVVAQAEMGGRLTRSLSIRGFVERVNALSGVGLEAPEFHNLRLQNGRPPFPRVQESYTKAGFAFSLQISKQIDLNAFWARTIQYKNTSIETHSGLGIGFGF